MNGVRNASQANLKQTRGALPKELKRNYMVYLMAFPGLLALLIFCYIPIFGIIIAFEKYSPAKGVFGSPWIGMSNFMKFFGSPYFLRCLKNTVGISLYNLALGFPAPIILALLLNELRCSLFKRTVQTVTYIPHFISMVVIAGIIIDFTASDGVINDLLSLLGFERPNLLMRPELFKTIFVLSEVWQGVGWGSIIYMAALTNIDSSLYEAAMIDGANRWKQTLHVTIPGIVPTIVTLFILQLGQIMSLGYEKIILIYNPTTLEAAETISTYVYSKGLVDMDYSYATAVGLFNSVINLGLVLAANKLSRKLTGVGLW